MADVGLRVADDGMESFVLVEPMRSPWSRTPPGAHELKAIPIATFDFRPSGALLWVLRGPPVGLVLGAAYGSWVPFIGTIVGGVIGAVVGLRLAGTRMMTGASP